MPYSKKMPVKVCIVGATGNVGSCLVRQLSEDENIDSVIAAARRPCKLFLPKVSFQKTDIRSSNLEPIFDGIDIVVHLAWVIQPSHDIRYMTDINYHGSKRLFEAAAKAGVKKDCLCIFSGCLLART